MCIRDRPNIAPAIRPMMGILAPQGMKQVVIDVYKRQAIPMAQQPITPTATQKVKMGFLKLRVSASVPRIGLLSLIHIFLLGELARSA